MPRSIKYFIISNSKNILRKTHPPCQSPVTDNGEAVPTPKENDEKKARQYPPLPCRSPRLHHPRHGCGGSDHPARRLHPLRRGLRRATQRLLEHPVPLQRQGAGRGDGTLLLRGTLPRPNQCGLALCRSVVRKVCGDDAVWVLCGEPGGVGGCGW